MRASGTSTDSITATSPRRGEPRAESAAARSVNATSCAVVGVPSDRWGETPVAYVTLRPGRTATPDDIKTWLNARVGKTQRLADVVLIDNLPRSHIGKVLKKDLRDSYRGPALNA